MISQELIKIPARAIHPLLIDLLTIKNELGDSAIPLITLVLHNGNHFKGRLMDAKFRKDSLDILFSIQDKEKTSGIEETKIMYMEGHSITGLIIHDPETIAEFLSTENLSKLLPGGSTKMDLKKKLVQVSEELAAKIGKPISCELNWEKLPQDEKQYSSISFFISEIQRIILKLSSDPISSQAIADQVEKLFFELDDKKTTTEISLDGKSLIISGPIKIDRKNNYQLTQLIEGVL